MTEWWERKKKKTRKSRKKKEDYTLGDLIADILFWLPEIIILPLRIIIWSFRGIGRLIGNIFDIA